MTKGALRIALAAIVASVPAGHAAAQINTSHDVVDPQIESVLAPMIGKETPGLFIRVVSKGKVIHDKAYGKTDLKSGTAFTRGTPTYIASVAKMFTAFGLLRLSERGALDLDATLGTFLPELPEYVHPVTIRQMLTHTSGIIDYYDVGGEEKAWTRQAVLDVLRDADSLQFKPGTKTGYSNTAYMLLGMVIEKVAKEPYDRFLQREFFTPLGMTHTRAINAMSDRPAGRAVGYHVENGAFTQLDYESTVTGAGGMYSTSEDLAKWGEAMRAGRILSPAMMKLASTSNHLPSGRNTQYGYGWLSETRAPSQEFAGKHYVAAIGMLRGFRAMFTWYEGDDLFITWAGNSDSNEVFDAISGMVPALLRRGGT